LQLQIISRINGLFKLVDLGDCFRLFCIGTRLEAESGFDAQPAALGDYRYSCCYSEFLCIKIFLGFFDSIGKKCDDMLKDFHLFVVSARGGVTGLN